VVTHRTTSPPVHCLNRAERTGSLVFSVLWSYVKGMVSKLLISRVEIEIATAFARSAQCVEREANTINRVKRCHMLTASRLDQRLNRPAFTTLRGRKTPYHCPAPNLYWCRGVAIYRRESDGRHDD
jgi:hypothetical protein